MSLKKDEILVGLKKGKHVLAVSGGVDSMVLLDIVINSIDSKNIIVAHVDHGIREESDHERRFVAEFARARQLAFESTALALGSDTSEATARAARYEFLRGVAKKHEAQHIVTAHHQNDVLETMVMNVLRGTGRRGLITLRSYDVMLRPLLGTTKAQLYEYAVRQRLEWIEDETNKSENYMRNRVRMRLLPQAMTKDSKFSEKLMKLRADITKYDNKIDILCEKINLLYTTKEDGRLSLTRQKFIMLPPEVRKELIMHILRSSGVELMNIGSSDVLRIEHFICTSKPAKEYSPVKRINIVASKSKAYFAFK